MASVTSERIPIATLHPSLPTPPTKSITAIVTILWPYSSSTRTCALLLAEPDFRLRRRRGQVRVQFFGDAAYAIATSQLGIGDKVVVKLGGVQWLQSSGEDEVVRTPGKSVDWELGFRDRLAMLVTRDGKQFANIAVERSTPEPEESEVEEEAFLNTPSKIVGRFSADGLRFNTWSSPAFLRHGRLSGESFSNYDLFADEDEAKSRKRRRTSFKNVGVWTYAARTPSPEKADAMSVDEHDLASPSERVSDSAPQAPALPRTPVSARDTPAEPATDDDGELVPESLPRETDPTMTGGTPTSEEMPLRGSLGEQDDALYEQYLEETQKGQEGDIEVDDFPGEPEDEPAAPFSLQDAELIEEGSDIESLPSVVTDTEVAAPSAAASVRIEDSAGDTEHESDADGVEVVDMSPTEVGSGEQEPGQETMHDDRGLLAIVRLSSTEEDTSEDEQVSVRQPGPRQPQQPTSSGILEQSIHFGHGVDETFEARTKPTGDSSQNINTVLEQPEDSAMSSTLVREKQEKPTSSQPGEGGNRPAGVSEMAASSNHAAPIMPPPVLPLPQANSTSAKSLARPPPIGPVNAPSTPQLQPVTSTNLPLPSPFPETVEACSYMDARPSSLIEQESSVAVTGVNQQEEHAIRPATAMSIAQASQEVLTGAQRESRSFETDLVAQVLEQAPNVPKEEPQLQVHEVHDFPFGLDGSVLSAIRASRTTSHGRSGTIDVQQQALAGEHGTSPPAEVDPVNNLHLNIGLDVEQTSKLVQRTPVTSVLEDVTPQMAHDELYSQGSQDPVAEKGGSPSTDTGMRAPDENSVVGSSLQQTDFPESDDTVMPVFQDDDWDMLDAAAETPSEAASTPKAPHDAKADDRIPTPQKRMLDPSTSQAEKPPTSSAVEIVDLGSDSSEEEDRPSVDASAEVQLTSPSVRREHSARKTATPKDTGLIRPVLRADEPPLTQEKHSPSLVLDLSPQTRRRTRQHTEETASQERATRYSTVESASQADISTPSRSQKRNFRSSQASRTSATPQSASGVAARVAQRRRRTEVKDSECEWDSNASISTQRPSSPSIPSDGIVSQSFEPSAGLEPSQILGELSQMDQQTREETPERPSASPITPAALKPASEVSPHGNQDPVEDPHEAQNQRLQKELEGDTDDDLAAERPSSPFPELNFDWRSKSRENERNEFEQEARSKQSSVLRDEFDVAGPTHSSMLQDDSSLIRAMRTSQFPVGSTREEQMTQSVEDDESQKTLRAPSPPGLKATEESQVETTASPPIKLAEESQLPESQFPDHAASDRQPPVAELDQLQALPSSPPVDAALDSAKLASRPQPVLESSILTPEASQEPSQLQSVAQKAGDDSHHLPLTPRLTQAIPKTPSFSHSASQVAGTQTVAKPRVMEASVVETSVEQQQHDKATTQDTFMTDNTVAALPPYSPKPADEVTVAESGGMKPSTVERSIVEPSTVEPSGAEISVEPSVEPSLKPSIEQRQHDEEATQDTTMTDDAVTHPPPHSPKSADNATLFEPTQPVRSTSASQPETQRTPRLQSPFSSRLLSQGTRTSLSYFTPLTHLRSYLNNSQTLVDVLVVCTRPNKPPVRTTAGARDYHTVFSVTDASLANNSKEGGEDDGLGDSVRVQVFRPWKPALPELDVGDAVLLRGFAVRSWKKGMMLVSGEESAWCVFRYGGEKDKKKKSQKDEGAEKKGLEKETKMENTIADSTRSIWADSLSGLWGAVAPEQQENSGEQDNGGKETSEIDVDRDDENADADARTRQRLHRHHQNPVSGAAREEVHGPPVEYGDEERRRAWELRGWWVGTDGFGVLKSVKGEEKKEAKGKEMESNGASDNVENVEKKDVAEKRESATDIFRSFL